MKLFFKPRDFLSKDSGSTTIETVLWFPVYTLIIGLFVDTSSLFMTQARMQEAVANAARFVAVGFFTDDEAEAYIQSRAATGETFTPVISTASGIVTAAVTMPVSDLRGLGVIAQTNFNLGASSSFRLETAFDDEG